MYLYVHWHILFYVVLTWVTPHKLTHLCIWKKKWSKLFLKMFPNIFEKKFQKLSNGRQMKIYQSIKVYKIKTEHPVKYVLFFFSRSAFKSPGSNSRTLDRLWFHFMIDIRSIPYQVWKGSERALCYKTFLTENSGFLPGFRIFPDFSRFFFLLFVRYIVGNYKNLNFIKNRWEIK